MNEDAALYIARGREQTPSTALPASKGETPCETHTAVSEDGPSTIRLLAEKVGAAQSCAPIEPIHPKLAERTAHRVHAILETRNNVLVNAENRERFPVSSLWRLTGSRPFALVNEEKGWHPLEDLW